MSAECFSWCPLRMRLGAKKKSTKAKHSEVSTNLCRTIPLTHRCVQKLPQNPPTIVPATTSPKNQVIEPKSDKVCRVVGPRPAIPLTDIVIQKLSENSWTAVPTTTDYITATGKEVLIVLESAAKVIPVPFLQDAIGVALKIIEVCEVR